MATVGIIGAGFVGSACAYALVMRNVCSDLVLIDKNTDRARAEAADIVHGAAIVGTARVRAGDYDDLKGAKVVVITAGVNQKPGESRLDLLARNAAIFSSIIPELARVAPEAVVVVATNPVDIMTDFTRRLHPHPERVLGTGTLLDSARYRQLIAQEIGIAARNIHANVLGEHGDSSVLCWDSARVAGLELRSFLKMIEHDWNEEKEAQICQQVRGAAGTIIKGKGATYYGIGASVAHITDAILSNSRGVYILSGPTDYEVCLSLPRVLGEDGILHTISPNLSAKERDEIERSAKVLHDSAAALYQSLEA